MTHPWLSRDSHRAWLQARFAELIRFSSASIRPSGGFFWLDAHGQPIPGLGDDLFLAARMAHAASAGVMLGVPGSVSLAEHAVRALSERFVDPEFGGWFSRPDAPDARKSSYDHVHVALAASSATVAGVAGGRELLDRVLEVIDTRLWDESSRSLTESWTRSWTDVEPYRGANVNMHGIEAFLAVGDVTQDARWHERARDMADRLINHAARAHAWVLPEHFEADWHEDLEYNADRRDDRFRPYGATPGHALEWARLLLALDASPYVGGRPWYLEAAEGLADKAFESWGADGIDGLPYTVDWQGETVVGLRLHWPVCEAIQATAQLGRRTGADRWEQRYRQAWEHAARYFVEPTGSWPNELDADLRPSESVWPGRPDVYHISGAYLGPLVGPSPFITAALAEL